MNSGIYCITNTVTGERYVGSAGHIPARQSAHFSDLKKGKHVNKHLQAACTRHGVDALSFEVLEHCATTQLCDRERAWCEKLKPEFNIARIGKNFYHLDLSARYVVCLSPEIEAAVLRFCEREGISTIRDGLRALLIKSLRTEGLL